MTSRSNQPSATANIDDLQAWAAKSKAAQAAAAGKPAAGTVREPSAQSSMSAPVGGQGPVDLGQSEGRRGFGGLRGGRPVEHAVDLAGSGDSGTRGSMLPKILIALGIGVAAYLVFSFIIGILMTMLMVLGGVAAIYAAYRVGLWQGRREER